MGLYSYCDVVRAADILHDILLLLQAVHITLPGYMHLFGPCVMHHSGLFYVVSGSVLL